MYAAMDDVIVLAILLLPHALCFNLDLRFPHVYHSEIAGDYFGFNVALHAGKQGAINDSWIMVGAPKSNDVFNIPEGGLVYKCSFGLPCKVLKIDQGKNNPDMNHWSGSMLGSVQDSVGDFQLTCAPRWKKTIDQRQYRLLGQCYISTTPKNPQFKTLQPFINDFNLAYTVKHDNTKSTTFPYQVYGQSGFSAQITKDGSAAILGAPGVFNFIGTAVLYDLRSLQFGSVVPNPYLNTLKIQNGYLGYAVTSGKYFTRSTTLYAAGAPRSQGFGRVSIFSFPRYSDEKIEIEQEFQGEQFGEYFGATLCTCDVNGDGLDDLLIGAPFYSELQDEGRVYVYHGNTILKQPNDVTRGIIKSTYPNGRFGTTISCLEDLDRDGYQDVAISAPYHEGGVVYIYNGGPGGLSATPSQTIVGTTISHKIDGFGYSISRGQDIDGNGYNDIAIGAYKSGHAVLIRSRPVVALHAGLYSHYDQDGLPRESKFLHVRTCIYYTGFALPAELSVRETIVVDPRFRRVTNVESEDYMKIQSGNDVDNCRDWNFTLQPNIRNFLEPIHVQVSYDLPLDNMNQTAVEFEGTTGRRGDDYFCAACPVVKNTQYASATKVIRYATECGTDNVCNSALMILSKIMTNTGRQNEFVVGSSTSLKYRVGVRNGKHADPAYSTIAEIYIPVRTLKLPPQCQEIPPNGTTTWKLLCDIANPLVSGNERVLNLEFDMTDVSSAQQQLNISARATTSSKDSSPDGVASTILTINLVSIADVTVNGKASPELNYFDTKDAERKNVNRTLNFVYQVEKFDVSPVNLALLTINYPVRKKGSSKTFLHLKDHELLINNNKLPCIVVDTMPTKTKRQVDNNAMLRTSRTDFPTNRTVFVNCTNNEWDCEQFQCSVGPFLEAMSLAQLQLVMHVDTTILESLMGKRDIIMIETDAHVKIVKPNRVEQPPGHKPDSAIVHAVLIGRIPPAKVETWILALSVIGGVLLLLVFISGLVKAGFFERKEKQALIKLKRETQMEFAAMQRASAMPPIPEKFSDLEQSDDDDE